MASKLRVWCNMLPYVAALFYGMNFVGAVLFMWFEHEQNVGFIDSLYWAFITSLSVGYGDISPATIPGQILAILLAKVVLLLIIPLIVVRMVDRLYEDKNQFSDEEQRRYEAKLDAILTERGIDPASITGKE